MTTHLRYWHDVPDDERGGAPKTLHFVPGLNDGSKMNVAEALAWAAVEWPDKSVPQTIIGGLKLRDGSTPVQIDDVMSGGQGEPTVASVTYQLRKGLPGYNRYKEEFTEFLQAFKDAGYIIDHIAFDIESDGLGVDSTYNAGSTFTMLSVLQSAYAESASEIAAYGGTEVELADFVPGTGQLVKLPDISLTSLAADAATREYKQSTQLWNAWTRQLTAARFNHVFTKPAKKIFSAKVTGVADCIVTNYDWSKHSVYPMLDWTNSGSATGRNPRPNATMEGLGTNATSAPVLYVNGAYYDSAQEALDGLYCVDKPCVPWVARPSRDSDEWSNNGQATYDAIIAGGTAYGINRWMVY